MLGLDFGTTNSAVARAARGGAARLAAYTLEDQPTTTFRSVLFFSPERNTYGQRPSALAGPEALMAYREAGGSGRFMQCLKSFLASRLFEGTHVFGWRFTLEELVALMLGALRAAAIEQLGDDGEAVLIGRPVHYVVDAAGDIDPERDRHALERMTRAAQTAGFRQVEFAYEPVAAAYEYERGLDHDELVLIGDFGGGTKFCDVFIGSIVWNIKPRVCFQLICQSHLHFQRCTAPVALQQWVVGTGRTTPSCIRQFGTLSPCEILK